MKKLILASASAFALFAAGGAFADNSVSTVTQDANSGDPSRPVIANVDQSGAVGSTSQIIQQNTAGGRVDVTQTDNGTAGTPDGQANTSYVRQDNASMFGSNPLSQVVVNQEHDGTGLGPNSSSVEQGPSTSSYVGVKQLGAQNNSVVDQAYQDRNIIGVDQTGANNNSNVWQASLNNSDAYVTQVNPSVAGPANNAFIGQGPGVQGFESPMADNEYAAINQNGSGNYSSIRQYKSDAGVLGTGREDASTANWASNSQTGDNHVSTIEQIGEKGYASVTQTGDGQESYLTQSGAGNTAVVSQSDADNLSVINQSGVTTVAYVTQSNESNESYITQGGTDNEAYVTQSSFNNSSSINQQGTNGTVTVNQH